MEIDTRHALGNGIEDETDPWLVHGGKNRLPRAHHYEHDPKRPPLSEAAGVPNPAINETRPIADMHPDGGTPTISKGIPFGMRMGEPYDD